MTKRNPRATVKWHRRQEAAAAQVNLTGGLVDLAARGRQPNCVDPASRHLWTSESDADRAQAAELCEGCPVWDLCAASAEASSECWGVWAGVDHSPTRANREEAA